MEKMLTFFLFAILLASWTTGGATEEPNKNIQEDCKVCGLKNGNNLKKLILEGDIVDPQNKYPWMVNINALMFCSGFIISDQHVMTAGHCVTMSAKGDPDPERTAVMFLAPSGFKVKNEVVEIFVNPAFETDSSESGMVAVNDIAILKLKEKIKCDEYANPICLPPADLKVENGTINQIVGSGAATKEGDFESKLRETSVCHIDFNICKEHLKNFTKNLKYSQDFTYCTKNLEKGKGPCDGDSGGPMFYEKDGKYFATGITSMSLRHPKAEECDPNYPSVYTSILGFMHWITNVTQLTPETSCN